MKLFLRSLLITSSNKVKMTWEIIKVCIVKSQLYNSFTKINSEADLITDITEIVNIFNVFFIKMAENLNNKYVSLYKALQLLEVSNMDEVLEMKLISVAEIEVINTVTFLKRKIASGCDGICTKILI
jgi:hypothetical protein